MKRYHTRNSTYEVDGDSFRRTRGESDPTPNFGEDGIWHKGSVHKTPDRLIFLFRDGARLTVSSALVSEEDV